LWDIGVGNGAIVVTIVDLEVVAVVALLLVS
jgi:hypothetical protein